MQKDHLPRPGRRRYVQRSSSDEGVRACRGWLDNDQQRGVFKWFKRMRRASRRLPVWKERLRAELRAIQAANAKAGRTAWCALEAESYNNLGYYNLSSSKRDGYAVIFLWGTKSYMQIPSKVFARSPDIS